MPKRFEDIKRVVMEWSEWFKGKNYMLPNRELIYTAALNACGTDASPEDVAPDELACAESATRIINIPFPDIQWTNRIATADVIKDMLGGKSFYEVQTPARGDVVISASAMVAGVWTVGHMGIVGERGRIMSNNSFMVNGERGIWDENYTLESWHRYFVLRKGLRMRYFRKR